MRDANRNRPADKEEDRRDKSTGESTDREIAKLSSNEWTTEDAAAELLAAGDVLGAAHMAMGPLPELTPVHVGTKRRPGRPRGRSWDEKITFPADSKLVHAIDLEAEIACTSRAAVIRKLLTEALEARATAPR